MEARVGNSAQGDDDTDDDTEAADVDDSHLVWMYDAPTPIPPLLSLQTGSTYSMSSTPFTPTQPNHSWLSKTTHTTHQEHTYITHHSRGFNDSSRIKRSLSVDNSSSIHRRTLFSQVHNISPTARLELAAVWFRDATHFRETFPMPTRAALRAHRILHRKAFRLFRKLLIFIHLFLAFVEPPSDAVILPTQPVEILCVAMLFVDLVLQLLIRRGQFCRDRWLVVKCGFVLVTLADTVSSIFLGHLGRVFVYRPLRCLRAYYLLENSRELRANTRYFLRILPRVLAAFGLVFVLIVVYSIAGIFFFLPISTDEYFTDFHTTAFQLFSLLTTVNFPDIMLPAYADSQWASLYFMSFLLVGVYFLLNMVLSVVVVSFRSFLREDYLVMKGKQEQSFDDVFELLKNPVEDADDSHKAGGKPSDCLSAHTFAQLLTHVYRKLQLPQATALLQLLCFDGSDRARFCEMCTIIRFKLMVCVDAQIELVPIHRQNACRDVLAALEETTPTEDQSDDSDDDDGPWKQGSKERESSHEESNSQVKHDDSDTDDLMTQQTTSQAGFRRTRSVEGQTRLRERKRRCCTRQRLRALTLALVCSTGFRACIGVMLVLNAVLIGFRVNNLSSAGKEWLVADIGFTVFFLLEMLLKLFAHGRDGYWSKKTHRYDLLVVCVAVCAEAFPDNRGPLVFRVLIVLRLIWSFHRLKWLSQTLIRLAEPFLGNFLLLIVIFYVYDILGMLLFAGTVRRGDPRLVGTLFDTAGYYDLTFDSFSRAFVVLFCLMFVNNWHVIASGFVAVTSWWALLYFLSFFFIIVYIVVNVVVAFFLDVFSNHLEHGSDEHPKFLVLHNENGDSESVLGQDDDEAGEIELDNDRRKFSAQRKPERSSWRESAVSPDDDDLALEAAGPSTLTFHFGLRLKVPPLRTVFSVVEWKLANARRARALVKTIKHANRVGLR